ncbi:MAG TPA: hypothetical protein P5280_15140 [Cyclobacteriaceae bacterium]|nr:hypothetical protein [Cyclobacteriaceae bacterium]
MSGRAGDFDQVCKQGGDLQADGGVYAVDLASDRPISQRHARLRYSSVGISG